ncbi:MAG: hypothetical protein LBU61_03915, partial [Coriobacteriales bacterium]|nr:hypothetical protein [Coriobacteriales bacterium]
MIKARLPDKTTLSIFSLTHLVVDFACFYLLMGSFTAATSDLQLLSLGFLSFYFIAFALQLPIGSLADC